MRFWKLFVSVLSSFKSEHPYYLAPPCIYKWNGNKKIIMNHTNIFINNKK